MNIFQLLIVFGNYIEKDRGKGTEVVTQMYFFKAYTTEIYTALRNKATCVGILGKFSTEDIPEMSLEKNDQKYVIFKRMFSHDYKKCNFLSIFSVRRTYQKCH